MIFVFYLMGFTGAFALTFMLAPIFIHIAKKHHFLDYPTERKQHRAPTPYLGGVTIYIGFWAIAVLGLSLAATFHDELKDFPGLPFIFFDIVNWLPEILGIFAGGAIVLVLGLLDDRYNLPPLMKFAFQSLAALILLKVGLQVNLVQELGWLGYAITFTWIVLLMNSFNFIDSIDGHCLGIAFISAVFFFLITQIVHQTAVALLVITFAGALFGLLPYNLNPARCFLGDNGSLFIGYMLSVITLLCRYNTNTYSSVTPFIPILMFGVPIYDIVSVVIVRTFRGIPFWKGDRNHLAHRLVRLGMNEKIAVLASYFIAFTLGLVALLSTQINTQIGKIILTVLFLSVIGIVALFEYYASLRIRLMEQLASQHKRRREDIRDAEDPHHPQRPR